MPDRMSDADVLAQTAEWLSRLADSIERVTEGLADSLARVQARQDDQADELRALSNRIEAATRTSRRVPGDPVPLEQTDEAL